jgi:hypothetical protein
MRYIHDCKKCVFLGCYEEYDLYVHWDDCEKSVIARYGNDGSQYISGLSFVTCNLALAEALRRAIDHNEVPAVVAYPVSLRRAFRDRLDRIQKFETAVAEAIGRYMYCKIDQQLLADINTCIIYEWRQCAIRGEVNESDPPNFDLVVNGSCIDFRWADTIVSSDRFDLFNNCIDFAGTILV